MILGITIAFDIVALYSHSTLFVPHIKKKYLYEESHRYYMTAIFIAYFTSFKLKSDSNIKRQKIKEAKSNFGISGA